MGEYKHNSIAIAAKNGELPAKPEKMSKKQEERLIQDLVQQKFYECLLKKSN